MQLVLRVRFGQSIIGHVLISLRQIPNLAAVAALSTSIQAISARDAYVAPNPVHTAPVTRSPDLPSPRQSRIWRGWLRFLFIIMMQGIRYWERAEHAE